MEQHPIISDNETVPKQINANEESLPPEKELQKPHPDGQFNTFLHDIADGITGAELKSMKHFFQGTGGISEVILKESETVLDLFTVMRTRRLLSRDNLIHLQATLQRIGRIDLVMQAAEYANTIGNVLHFYPASFVLGNGIEYLTFRVGGCNFRNSSRGCVQRVRNKVAEILFVPVGYVFIAGLDRSLLITLMIPELYFTILKKMLQKCNRIPELKELIITKVYTIEGTVAILIERPSQKPNNEENRGEGQEKQQNKCVKTEARPDKPKHCELDATEENQGSQLHDLIRVLSITSDEPQFVTQKKNSSLIDFTKSLNQCSSDSVDITVAPSVLTAKVKIVPTTVGESHRVQELALLMYELERFKFLTNVSNMGKATLDNMQFLLESVLSIFLRIHDSQLQNTNS